jgi:hypothetical protein
VPADQVLGGCEREVGFRCAEGKSFKVDEEYLVVGAMDEVALVGIAVDRCRGQDVADCRVSVLEFTEPGVEEVAFMLGQDWGGCYAFGDAVEDVELG